MRDIGHEKGVHFPRNRAETLEVEEPRVGAGTADEDLRLHLLRDPEHLVVVDLLALLRDSVAVDGVPLAGEVDSGLWK